ncbi:MAG: MarR family transcriptional regulator [Azospirillaceae bacterium]|nr:MarR family transcriptional regulator [Azospirillaceae bacterium]
MIDRPDNPQDTSPAAAVAAELRALVGKLRRRLREQASPGDFTPSQISVLQRLERQGPATVSSLARAEGMRPQSMSATVAPLEAAGLLSGAPDPNDGRQTLLSLTDHCRRLLADGRAARQDWLTRTLQSRLSVAEQHQVAVAIELLKRLAGE